MTKVPIRSSNYGVEPKFEDAYDIDSHEAVEVESSHNPVDVDELSNLLSDAMNLFYHHDYRSLKEVSDRILSIDYHNIRGCLYKSFSEFFDQFDQYELETVNRWNEVDDMTDMDAFIERSNCDFINDINRYFEYMESLENLSRKLSEISEITELLREEEIVQEIIIERLVFIDQKIAVSIKKETVSEQPFTGNSAFDSLKKLYVDRYELIIMKRDQLLNLSEKEYCYRKNK